jgi:hypothetical protein
VRELVIATIRSHVLVWGGHPSITPMIWSICEDLGVDYSQRVALYQSTYWADRYPEETARFQNVTFVDAVEGNEADSLLALRTAMFSRPDLAGAVFIGGMKGVEAEFDLFRQMQPAAGYLVVPAPGGAARDLAHRLGHSDAGPTTSVNFASMYQATIVRSLDIESLALKEAQRRLAQAIAQLFALPDASADAKAVLPPMQTKFFHEGD